MEDKHLGPQIMKQKVKDGGGYDAYGSGSGSANRPGSRMRAAQNGSAQGPSMSSMKLRQDTQNDDNSNEDYNEDFDDKVEDDGLDEMERIRQAMAKEKLKAQKFKEK